jgi:serine/threonine protein kinase
MYQVAVRVFQGRFARAQPIAPGRRPPMLPSPCPPREQLSGYARGLLADDVVEAVAEHVEHCTTCETALRDLDTQGDPLIEQLRQPVAADAYAAEPACRQAVERIAALGQTPAPLGTIRTYQLLEKLGEGGMGKVYKALHTDLGKVVALKVVASKQLDDARAVVRFKREMKAVGKLEHPNIVRALDAGEDGGRHYLMMEYVEGRDVGKLVERLGPLPVADACAIVRQAALGLQHAHEHGLVHRDIKPSNLLLAVGRPGEEGVVKLADFGLALLVDRGGEAGSELTGEGQMMGTFDYMAPEQAGDTHQVDIRADLYSLGATLYKLLCGAAPFAGKNYRTPLQKVTALVQEQVPPLATRRTAGPLPAELVHRLLEKGPRAAQGRPQRWRRRWSRSAAAATCRACCAGTPRRRRRSRPRARAARPVRAPPCRPSRSGRERRRFPRPGRPGPAPPRARRGRGARWPPPLWCCSPSCRWAGFTAAPSFVTRPTRARWSSRSTRRTSRWSSRTRTGSSSATVPPTASSC